MLEGLLLEEGELGGFEPYDPVEPSPEGRVDLRDELAFTIDPETAKDFDDALTLHEDRVLVHIADVSWFVGAGTPLDRGAAARAFSVYVPGLVSPMLPPELSNDLCSLRPHLDRLCVTVEVELATGEARFYRSVIRSGARLTYGQAEAILAGRERAEPELTEALRRAERVTSDLRARRFGRGALRIESSEATFAFDGEGGVADAWRESEPHAHMLVEELMILANEALPGLLAGRRREALFRVHERPEPQAVELLLAKLADLGVPTPPAPERLSPADAAQVAAEASERVDEYAASPAAGGTRSRRWCSRRSSGRATTRGTSGTPGSRAPRTAISPRPFAATRIWSSPGAAARARRLGRAAARGSARACRAGLGARARRLRSSSTRRTRSAWRGCSSGGCSSWGWEEAFEGEVTGLIPSGLFVRFADVFEGFVPARRLPGDYFELNTLGTALVGRRGGRTHRLGDPLEVRVVDIRRNEGKVELAPAARRDRARD